MRGLIIVVIHCAVAILPYAARHGASLEPEKPFPGWPTELAGRPLNPLPVTAQERGFIQGFPGKIGRFSAGSREIIIRYVERPTRRLHPSADCLRGSGYRVSTQPVRRDGDGRLWGCVLAVRDGERYRVCEHIHDETGNGWYDVSSWFWTVVLRDSEGPWWAITLAEKV